MTLHDHMSYTDDEILVLYHKWLNTDRGGYKGPNGRSFWSYIDITREQFLHWWVDRGFREKYDTP